MFIRQCIIKRKNKRKIILKNIYVDIREINDRGISKWTVFKEFCIGNITIFFVCGWCSNCTKSMNFNFIGLQDDTRLTVKRFLNVLICAYVE